ncbi:hypothetical protein N0V94_005078 [Neodidymelliopsis sp. IMI 364377]|nr:hypothetical protein N0V94_005078 [Neodidymelliopsis sp. IMI 364377]
MVVKLAMGIWAGIAAGSVMVMLVLLPILGYIFSRSKKNKKAAETESAAEKGELVVEATSAPTKPTNAILQKPSDTKLSKSDSFITSFNALTAAQLDAFSTAYATALVEILRN